MTMGEEDEFFRKPGTVPFKWESKPGVPKPYHTPKSHHHHHHSSSRLTLTPPPSSYRFTPSPNLGSTSSFRSAASLRSDRQRPQPAVVSDECFFSPLLRSRWAKKKSKKVAHKASPETQTSSLSTLSRFTDSARKSMSLWESSNCSSSFSSFRSSPQPVPDQEYARYRLF